MTGPVVPGGAVPISDEAVEAALGALLPWYGPGYERSRHTIAHTVLAAAVPHLREQIAAEIHDAANRWMNDHQHAAGRVVNGFIDGVRLAELIIDPARFSGDVTDQVIAQYLARGATP